MKHISRLIISLMVFLTIGCPVTLSADIDCYSMDRWEGYLYNDSTYMVNTYTPDEYFGTSYGAFIPDFDPTDSHSHTHYYFNDTTCISQDWEVYVKVNSFMDEDSAHVVFGISPFGAISTRGLRSGGNSSGRLLVMDTVSKNNNGLKLSTSTSIMGFKYTGGYLYYYRNNSFYYWEKAQFCGFMNLAIYWEKSGGAVEWLMFYDNENGTEMFEDFSSCSDMSLLPECEPEPDPTIEASYVLPTCSDSNLYLFANSNTLTTYNWMGLGNSFYSKEQNPVLDCTGLDGQTLTFVVWSRKSYCYEPVSDTITVTIPSGPSTTYVDSVICHGHSYEVGSNSYTETGVYSDTLKNVFGCDSIVVSNLTFTFIETDVFDTICVGSSYSLGDSIFTAEGKYNVTLKNDVGCDSVVTLHLTTYKIESELYDTICEGSSYDFNGQLLTEMGDYESTVKTADGCDSTITLHLITYKIESELYDSICVGSSYDFNGQLLTEMGDYESTVKTADGCDSTITLHLTTFRIESYVYDTICVGSSYDFNGRILTESGVYESVFKTADGCDSAVVLHLETNLISNDIYDTICVGSVYDFHGLLLTTDGIYADTVKTSEGCDSLVLLHLSTYQISGEYYDSICVGSTYSFNGLLLTSAGDYTSVVKTADGCDSLVTLHLHTYSIGSEISELICEGTTYDFNGQILGEPGDYTSVVKTAGGCDSTITLHLSTFKITSTVYDTICEGYVLNFNGLLLSEAGDYETKIKTADGCDSTITLHLTTYRIESVVNENICEGSTYNFNGQQLTEPGTYTSKIKTADGCDSTITLHLTTYKIVENISAIVCYGESYSFGGKKLTSSGSYTAKFKTADGCDSTVVLKLTVLKRISPTVHSLSLCNRSSVEMDGKVFSSVGSFYDTLTSVNGCDSVVVYNVHDLSERDTTVYYRICQSEPVLINGQSYDRDTTFSTVIQFDDNECPMRTVVHIYVSPAISIDDREFSFCGSLTNRVYVDSVRKASYLWIPDTGVSNVNIRSPYVTVNGEQNYQVVVSAGYCVDTVSVYVRTTSYPIIERILCTDNGNNLIVNVRGGVSPYYYQIDSLTTIWFNDYEFGHLDKGVHTLYVKDEAGCVSHRHFNYFIPLIPAEYMTPNGDGVHDTWEIKNIEYYDEYKIRIFNRFGKLLVEYINEYPGWDGVYDGIPQPTTDYWYTIECDFNETNLSGHFTLLR